MFDPPSPTGVPADVDPDVLRSRSPDAIRSRPPDAVRDRPADPIRSRLNAALLQDALAGLAAPHKTLPSKYFYDETGSKLFEAICALPEYHVTRTELALLTRVADEAAAGIPPGAALVEFGSGASVKTRLLIEAARDIGCYVPVDISPSALAAATARLANAYPDLLVAPVVADFTASVTLPPAVGGRPVVGFFPGSTIGNFTPAEAVAFLKAARKLLGPRSCLLLGADLTREPTLLEPAYDDAAGVTAAFNLNLLTRLNRECDARFDRSLFAHRARWNADLGRVEMHLQSLAAQTVTVAGRPIRFGAGETIHTENSHKYRAADVGSIAARAGWRIDHVWTGDDPLRATGRTAAGRFGLFRLI